MAKFLTKFFIFGIICSNFNFMVLAQFTCNPTVDCSTRAAGEKVPDPLNCEQYYLCIEIADGSVVASTIPLGCGYGYYFDHSAANCTAEAVPDSCENLCRNECNISCPVPFQTIMLIANKDNCSLYSYCLVAGPLLEVCPPESPYFNGAACVADATACCDFCDPYCYTGGIQIEDPCDCTSFYVCVGQGEASTDNRGTCDAGQYYDELTAACLPGICDNFCTTEQCLLSVNRKR